MKEHEATLTPPFPSPPARPPKYNLSFYRDNSVYAHHSFYAPYAAVHFIEEVIDNVKPKWLSTNSMLLKFPTGNVTIECAELEDLMERKLTPDEKAWQLPTPYQEQAISIRKGTKPKIKLLDHVTADGKRRKEIVSKDDSKHKSAPRVATPSGFVSLGDLCTEHKIEARLARQVLRKKENKPKEGWCWPKKEVDRIVKLLKKEIK